MEEKKRKIKEILKMASKSLPKGGALKDYKPIRHYSVKGIITGASWLPLKSMIEDLCHMYDVELVQFDREDFMFLFQKVRYKVEGLEDNIKRFNLALDYIQNNQ